MPHTVHLDRPACVWPGTQGMSPDVAVQTPWTWSDQLISSPVCWDKATSLCPCYWPCTHGSTASQHLWIPKQTTFVKNHVECSMCTQAHQEYEDKKIKIMSLKRGTFSRRHLSCLLLWWFLVLGLFLGFLLRSQVIWDGQGAATDSQLKERPSQPVSWYAHEEVLNLLQMQKQMIALVDYFEYTITKLI